MLHNDLICDFNLYLCEKFGYRNCCSVMQNANGFCYKYLFTESDEYGYYQTLGLGLVRKDLFGHNYALALKDLNV